MPLAGNNDDVFLVRNAQRAADRVVAVLDDVPLVKVLEGGESAIGGSTPISLRDYQSVHWRTTYQTIPGPHLLVPYDVILPRNRSAGVCKPGVVSVGVGLRPPILGQAVRHVVKDVLGILGPGIVGGDDDYVSLLVGDLHHDLALFRVPVAATPEHKDDSPDAADALDSVEEVLQRVGRVGVVDNHREGLPFIHFLKPPRDAVHRLETRRDRLRKSTKTAQAPSPIVTLVSASV